MLTKDLPLQRPLLRGWSHALAVALALFGTIVLVNATRGDNLKQLSLLLYGTTVVLLFTISATYHLGRWAPPERARLRRVDHATIFVMIAGTYTPIAVTILSGPARIALLAGIWALALLGVGLVLYRGPVRRGVLTALYLALGWLSVAIMPLVIERVGWAGVANLAAGGLLYSVGAVAYALKRPRLWASVFGYHEVFHLFVIAAGGAFYIFMLQEVVSLPIR